MHYPLTYFTVLNQGATVKDGDTLAITTALLPIVFPQMPVRFSAYITYNWDFHKAWNPTTHAMTHHDGIV